MKGFLAALLILAAAAPALAYNDQVIVDLNNEVLPLLNNQLVLKGETAQGEPCSVKLEGDLGNRPYFQATIESSKNQKTKTLEFKLDSLDHKSYLSEPPVLNDTVTSVSVDSKMGLVKTSLTINYKTVLAIFRKISSITIRKKTVVLESELTCRLK